MVSASITLFVVKFVKRRRFYAGLVSRSLVFLASTDHRQPSPNHSFLFVNLKTLADYIKRYPKNFHPQLIFTDIGVDHDLPDLYYVDLFPVADSIIIISNPDIAIQILSDAGTYPQHSAVRRILRGLVGTVSLLTTEGSAWRRQRNWVAPAFSTTHLMTLVSGMVEESLVFKEILTKHAVKKEVFKLDNDTSRLAMDIIGHTVGDLRLKSQTQDCSILNEFLSAISWTVQYTAPPWKHIISAFMIDRHLKKLDDVLGKMIKESFKSKSEDSVDKSILDLAMKGYLKDNSELSNSEGAIMDQDEEFMRIALDK